MFHGPFLGTALAGRLVSVRVCPCISSCVQKMRTCTLTAVWVRLGRRGLLVSVHVGTLGPSEPPWRPSWRPSSASWRPLGPSWGPLGAVLGASWAVMGPSWRPLGRSWGDLGGLLGRLGPSGGRKCANAKIMYVPQMFEGFGRFLLFGLPTAQEAPKIAQEASKMAL